MELIRKIEDPTDNRRILQVFFDYVSELFCVIFSDNKKDILFVYDVDMNMAISKAKILSGCDFLPLTNKLFDL